VSTQQVPVAALHEARIIIDPKELRDNVMAFTPIANSNTTGRYIGKGDIIDDPRSPSVQVQLSTPAAEHVSTKFDVNFVTSSIFGAHTVLLRAVPHSEQTLGDLFGRKETDDYGFDFYLLVIEVKLHDGDQGEHIVMSCVASILDDGNDHDLKALVAMSALLAAPSTIRRLAP
jgi:hypothetical protein